MKEGASRSVSVLGGELCALCPHQHTSVEEDDLRRGSAGERERRRRRGRKVKGGVD